MVCRPTDTPPKPAAIAACRGRLLAEVGSHPRTVILALGNSAVRSLMGDNSLKITQVRGKVLQSPYGPIVPAIHPAALLRNNGEYARWQQDLAYAASLLNGGVVKGPGTVTKWIVDTPGKLRKAVDFLLGHKVLAADIETTGFNPRGHRILCLSVSWAKNRAVIIPLDATYLREWSEASKGKYRWKMRIFSALGNPQLKRLLEAPGPRWVWHNGKFDASFFRARHLQARVDEDCMLMHYALNEQRGTHDLKQLAQDLLGAEDYSKALKPWLPNKSVPYDRVPPDVLFEYAARDTDSTFQIYGILKAEIGNPRNVGLAKLYSNLFIPTSTFLQQVEARGMWVAQDKLDLLERELSSELGSKLETLTQLAIESGWNAEEYAKETGAVKVPRAFNPNAPGQVLWLLVKRMGYKPLSKKRDPKTNKFKYTTDQTVLKELRPKHPFIQALLIYRNTAKSLATYAYGTRQAIDESDGRIHPTFLIHGTTTGRLSARNPNVQNFPRVTSGRWGKLIRDMFQAPPGYQFLEFDYSQVELRVLAYLSGDPDLQAVYTEGKDLHDEVATALFGPGFNKEQRIRAKFVNFGIAYGRGAESLAQEFKIPKEEGAAMIRGWFQRFPVAHEYLMAQRQAVVDGRTLATPFGRRRRFGLVTRETLVTLQNEAANFAIQSTASDLTLISAQRMLPALQDRFGAHIVNLIHDSILVEAPSDVPPEVIGQLVQGVMRDTPCRMLRTKLPFETSMAWGKAWGSLEEH